MRLYIVILGFVAICANAEPNYSLEQASVKARESLPIFWENFVSENQDPYTFEIKAKFALQDGRVITAWVGKLELPENGYINGFIMRKPNKLEHHSEFNKPARFTVADVLDWGFRLETEDSAGIYGHFTTRLMLNTMPERDQSLWKGTLAPMPLPKNFEK